MDLVASKNYTAYHTHPTTHLINLPAAITSTSTSELSKSEYA